MRAARYVLAALAIALGVAGLLRGNAQPGDGSGPAPPARAMAVSGLGVIAADGPTASVRLTITNNTGVDDRLLGISSGAGGSTDVDGAPVRIDAGATVRFGPAQGRTVTIVKLYGPVAPGQTVTLSLDFARAGSVLVEAPVVAQ